MQTRHAHLLDRSQNLCRSITASFSFRKRFALVMFRLGVYDSLNDFGRIVYTEFIRRGVQGMPPIGTIPASQYNVQNKLVPSGYGKEFAKQVNKIVRNKLMKSLAYVSDINMMIEDAMQETSIKVAHGIPAIEGFPLKKAEGFVAVMTLNEARDMLKAQKNLFLDLDSPVKEGGSALVELLESKGDIADIWETLHNNIDFRKILPEIEADLRKIPGGLEYFRGRLEDPDSTDAELIGDKLIGREALIPYFVEHPTDAGTFRSRTKPKIIHVFQKHLSV